jgi:hypothetical protein
MEKKDDQILVPVATNEDVTCYFCHRPRPIFIVDNDDMILRMPERYLPPFLKSLKQDFINKKQYLKYLRISSNLIRSCECTHKICHAYCTTAFLLRTQKIFCKDCNSYFQLYVRWERIFSTEYLGTVFKLMLITFVFGAAIFLVQRLDSFLKNTNFVMEKITQMENDNVP